MRKRVLVWGGAAVAVVAAAALIVYFVRVGLDDADKLASVIALFVTAAGLGVAIHGLRGREHAEPQPGGVTASGAGSVAVGGDNSGIISTGDGTTNIHMSAEASGQGRVYQAGGDQTIDER
ncbi:hypothetical protein [Nonomuraea rubra]|uniref:Uncharacterized protein n=1 Tax=Nonomuraea rubra TaxID=46180 RepID=A0A7X0U4X6_9ACTN|nr:hypothetical protein [Nonomuraea rubra]MBB6554940.1 hypothetical protein [Nonomuraea rubra]